MTFNFPERPKNFIKDLADFNQANESIHMSASAKSIDRLNNLSIANLWLIGANEKELRKILSLTKPRYLNLYQVLAKDLKVLESLNDVEILILNWNTKASEFWDISHNVKLKTLEVIDFSKVTDISQIAVAKQLTNLTLSGGHGKPIRIKTLEPLAELDNLKYLGLSNIKVDDDSLRPIGKLKGLQELEISNQFETEEYAWLATRLKNTRCKMFQATNPCNIVGTDNKTVWDTMVTGRKKSFLLSSKDKTKIDKLTKDFELLKERLSK